MLQRLGFCFLSCILSLAGTAAEPARNLPNVRAITACLRRNRASLSEACRAVFDQAGG